MSMFNGVPSTINGKNNPEYLRKYKRKYSHTEHGRVALKRYRMKRNKNMAPEEYADSVLASMRKDYDTPIYY